MILLDTNFIVTYLTGYNQNGELDKVKRVINSGLNMFIPWVVLHELTMVLTKYLKLERTEVEKRIIGLIQHQNFQILGSDKALLISVFDIWVSTNLDFTDCFLLAKSYETGWMVASLDKELLALQSK